MSTQDFLQSSGSMPYGSYVLRKLELASREPNPENTLLEQLLLGLRGLKDAKERTGPLGNEIWGGIGLDPAFWESTTVEKATRLFYQRAKAILQLPLPDTLEEALEGEWDEFAFTLLEAITAGFTLRTFKDPSFRHLLSISASTETQRDGESLESEFVDEFSLQLCTLFLRNIDEPNRFDFVDLALAQDPIRDRYKVERCALDLFLLTMITESTVYTPEIRECIKSSLLRAIEKHGMAMGWIPSPSGFFGDYCSSRHIEYARSWDSYSDRDSRIRYLANAVLDAIDEGSMKGGTESVWTDRQHYHRQACTYIDSTLHHGSEHSLKWIKQHLHKYAWIMQRDNPSLW